MYEIEEILELPELQPHADIITKEYKKIHDYQSQFELQQVVLEFKRAHAMLSIYNKQREIYKRIPEFWAKFFTNHEDCSYFLEGQDFLVMNYLRDVEFSFSSIEPLEFKILFHFAKNPYFENKELVFDIKQKEDNTLENKPFTFEWAEKGNLIEATKKDHGADSFFYWFTQKDASNFLLTFIEGFGKYHEYAFLEDEGDDEEDEEEVDLVSSEQE